MSDWRHWPYPFPADGGVEVLLDVLDRVPTKFGAVLDWTQTDKFVVLVADVKSAVYLRLGLGGSRLTGADGKPILEECEVLVSEDEKAECEAMLRENCPTEATWFSLVVIHTRTEEAWQAFNEAYWAVIEETPLKASLQR